MFLNDLVLLALPTPKRWRVYVPLYYDDGILRHTVEAGTETDLASVPDLIATLDDFDPCGLSRRPAVLHDDLYKRHITTRLQADEAFYRALIAEGMDGGAAWAHYVAVRRFGAIPWRKAGR